MLRYVLWAVDENLSSEIAAPFPARPLGVAAYDLGCGVHGQRPVSSFVEELVGRGAGFFAVAFVRPSILVLYAVKVLDLQAGLA